MAIKALRGMKDILPQTNSKKFTHFIEIATQIAKNFGFEYMETPILEETKLFARGVGESSDIVGKEMYQFIDKGKNDVCLRPEGTAGVVRSFVENKYDRAGGSYKFFYYGPMFRYERPQKGRFREFHQFGCESFGEASVYEDANIIMMIATILERFNVEYTLKINSLGCTTCMPPYRAKLVSFLEEKEAIVCEDCTRRTALNPIRVLDCKNEACQNEYVSAPKLRDNLCPNCQSDFEKLQALLVQNGIAFEIDTNLVRGLDYYNKSAFEFVSTNLGAQDAIAGGGRYDGLVELLDGKPTSAVGFAIGIERFLELIDEVESGREGYYFGALNEQSVDVLFKLGMQYAKEQKVSIEYKPRSLKAHLKNADKKNARFCIIIGEDELKESLFWIKDLDSKEERREALA